MPEKYLNIIISGGGTGGHIFPAIAIADALKSLNPTTNILFVGATGKMEMEKVPAAGYPIEGIPIRGLQRRLSFSLIAFPFRLLVSLVKARNIIRRFKPDVAVGVGGYASGPLLRSAMNAGIPTIIQEQNSWPGVTNRLLAGKADRICVAYEGMEKHFPHEKILLLGNPVRKEILNLDGKMMEAAGFFNLDTNRKTLLVTGGSQGARTVNESIRKHLQLFISKGFQVIWQCGKSYFPVLSSLIPEVEDKGIRIMEFIYRMDLAFAIADVVVSRAGALSVSELCVAGKPAILIPSPNVAEDHQTHNAMALVKNDAAILVKNSDAIELLGGLVTELMNDHLKSRRLSENIRKMAYSHAAEQIAAEVLAIAYRKTKTI